MAINAELHRGLHGAYLSHRSSLTPTAIHGACSKTCPGYPKYTSTYKCKPKLVTLGSQGNGSDLLRIPSGSRGLWLDALKERLASS